MNRSVVVMGAGLGGLSAAIHSRIKGHEVTVLEQRSICGGKAASILHAGYRLDPGPSIVILPRVYEEVFKRAGRKMSDYLQFRRLPVISQVRFEESEVIEIPDGMEATSALLRQLAPADVQAFESLMRKLRSIASFIDGSVFKHPYHHAWQLMDPRLVRTALPFDVRRSYKELIDSWFQSPLLRAFFYGFPSYGGQSYNSKSIGALMIPYLMLEEGVWYPEGGVGSIPEAFERLARELGVQFQMEAAVVGVERQEDKLTAALLSDGSRVEANFFISNIDRFTFQAILGNAVELEPSYSYFTLHWGLKRKLKGLAHHTLLIPSDFEKGFEQLYASRQFPESPIVYLNETSATDPSTAPEGCTNLFAVVTSPAKEVYIDWPKQQSLFRERTLSVMRRLGVEIEVEDIAFERVQTPDTFEERDGSYRGSLYGLDERHRLWGLFPERLTDRTFKNLFYAGGSVQPGAGMPMVTLSGKFASDLIP